MCCLLLWHIIYIKIVIGENCKALLFLVTAAATHTAFLSCTFVIPDPIVDGGGNEGKAEAYYTLV
jgi:hypothetical protein